VPIMVSYADTEDEKELLRSRFEKIYKAISETPQPKITQWEKYKHIYVPIITTSITAVMGLLGTILTAVLGSGP
ncbi:unnamed protein product, partial [marine sediment metagenome]